MLLPSTATHAVGIQNAAATSEKQKTLASIREIQVHKHWTKVYFQKRLTAMYMVGVIQLRLASSMIDVQS